MSGHGCCGVVGSTRTQTTGTQSLTAAGTGSLPQGKRRCFLFKHNLQRRMQVLVPLTFLIITQNLENWRGQGDAHFLLSFLKFKMFQGNILIFPKCLTRHMFFEGTKRKIRISFPPVSAPRADAWPEILWAEKFSSRIWLSHICPLLHLVGTSHGTKASGRWTEGHPSPCVGAPSPLPCPLLPWLSTHSPRADVGL